VDVCLVARDSAGAVSGGHRYHEQLLTRAGELGVTMWVERPRVRRTLPDTADVVVLDGLDAGRSVLARHGRRGRGRPRLVALAHQRPGGTDRWRAAQAVGRWLDLAVYRSCDLVVVAGAALGADLVAQHGLEPSRIVVVEPGCDLPSGPAVAALRGQRRLGLLHVANWLPNKDVLTLLDAVGPVGDVTLHLAGRRDVAPAYTAAVERRIARRDLAGRVVVHGPLPPSSVASLYAAADAFAFPSRVETYGTAAAEALRSGLPVLGWRTPHLLHLVDDGVEGLLAPTGDIAALSRHVRHLAGDERARRTLAMAAARRGARLPTWRQTAERFFAALARLGAESVEPPHDRSAIHHVDPADPGILDEQVIGHGQRDPERPCDRRLHGTDVRHDDHD
jgi:glycosyltransferase involved in cell wall biosynthesis